jgi:CHAT domain-containing protein
MDWKPEEENVIRRYLLDDATTEERQRVEEQLLEDDDYGELLLLIEGELIDDYAGGAMSEREQSLFVRNFLFTPYRQETLAMATEVVKHSARNVAASDKAEDKSRTVGDAHATDAAARHSGLSEPRGRRGRREFHWLQTLFTPAWKGFAYALLILGVGLSGWWWSRSGGSEIEKGLTALNRAYLAGRPLEARISGMPYARFTVTRGNGREGLDYRPRELAERILLEEAEKAGAGPDAQHALGKLYLAKKEFGRAITHFEIALRVDSNNARLRSDYAAALFEKGKIERLDAQSGKGEVTLAKSLEQFNKALELDDSLLEAIFNRALLHQALGMTDHAREDWKKYREKDSSSPWAVEAQENLNLLGEGRKKVSQNNEQLYQSFLQAYHANDRERALQSFNLSYNYSGNFIVWRLIENFLETKPSAEEAVERLRALSYIGDLVKERTGDSLTADLANYYRQARPDQRPLLAIARRLMKDGFGLSSTAKNEAAIELYAQAKRLFEQTGNVGEALLADALIGHSHHLRSDPQRSREIFARLALQCEARNYYWMQTHALCGVANAHQSANEFSQAIKASSRARELAERIGDVAGIARCLSLLGNNYYNLGKHEENLRISARGREICGQLPEDPARASGFYLLPALSLIALGLCEAALDYQNEALKMAEGRNAPRLFGRLYVQRGRSYAGLNKYDRAIEDMRRGIAIGQGLQSDKTGREFMAYGLLSLGHVYHAAGMRDEALQAFNQVIDFHQPDDRQSFLYQAYKGRLMALIAREDVAARKEVDDVIALFERYRKNIREESNRNSFFHEEQNIYDIAIDFAQSRLGNAERALDYLELSRSRSLLDASRRSREIIDDPDLPELLIETAPPIEMADLKPRLPQQAQLLEYAALKDKLLIWLITKDAPIESEVVPVSLDDLTGRVDGYLAAISQSPTGDEAKWQGRGRELYDLLIRPFAARIDERRQLCIVPDKALNRLPFGALVADEAGRFLVEKYRMSYAASANMFLFSTEMARRKADRATERLLAVSNTRFDRQAFPKLEGLRWAAEEAARVASFYDAPALLTDGKATKREVLKEIRRSDVAHLAMHYVPSERSPMLSQLLLAPGDDPQRGESDGLLQAHEIYRLGRLRPRLVALSACQTTAEGFLSGEGAIGLSRPFQAAGVPLIVASLWLVEEKASMQLMVEFHRRRRLAGLPTVDALSEAQRSLLRGESHYRHPYYWAAFITIGGYSEY